MFEFLNKYTIEQVTSAIYYAIRTLKHLKNIELETLESEKYIKEKDLGIQIVSSIIDNEGKLLSDFDQTTKEKYTMMLYAYLDSRNQLSLRVNKNTELDLLRKWRNESVHSYAIKDYNLNYTKKIFISYYENDQSVDELKNILDLAKIEAIEWKSLSSHTIIHNFIESIISVSFAVFVINNHANKIKANQLFELGYLFGKLGRDKILILVDSNTQLPTDLSGIMYLEKDTPYWKLEFLKRLDFSGFQFDKKIIEKLYR